MEDTLRVLSLETWVKKEVLILVLMEDTLRESIKYNTTFSYTVLILVLMEDTLRDADEESSLTRMRRVLILVLMEDTLRAEHTRQSLCL